jgi:TetR/AcrR family tetracycline transcriptional repressor
MRLKREIIVRHALALVDEIGLDGLTVRRLAERLQVQNPALYRHVTNKQDLLDSMAEMMLNNAFQPLAEPTSEDVWDVWLMQLAHAFHRMLLSQRDGARIIASANLPQRQLLLGFDWMLHLLQAGGFSQVTSFHAIKTIFDYTIGSVFEEQTDPQLASARLANIQQVNETEPLPTLTATLAEIVEQHQANETGDSFEAGLHIIILGLRATRIISGRPG